MAKPSFAKQLESIVDITLEEIDEVMKGSITDVIDGAQTTQLGITRGAASFEEGKIPLGQTEELYNSLSVNGGPPSATGYKSEIKKMKLGENIKFEWIAKHALPIEQGWTTKNGTLVPGRHFIGKNVAKFYSFVSRRVGRLRK